jgi:hypothetical protein
MQASRLEADTSGSCIGLSHLHVQVSSTVPCAMVLCCGCLGLMSLPDGVYAATSALQGQCLPVLLPGP